jgi:hypothetical protein
VVTRDRKPATIEAGSRLSFRAGKTCRLPGGLNTNTAVRGTHPSAADLDYQRRFTSSHRFNLLAWVANRCFVRLSILLARFDI